MLNEFRFSTDFAFHGDALHFLELSWLLQRRLVLFGLQVILSDVPELSVLNKSFNLYLLNVSFR